MSSLRSVQRTMGSAAYVVHTVVCLRFAYGASRGIVVFQYVTSYFQLYTNVH